MARQIIWSDRSLELLKEILEYWIERNGTANYSDKLYSLFQIALKQLSKYPETGGLTENRNIRYKKVRTYYIYFSYNDTTLRVIAISHVRRGPEFTEAILR